MSEAIPVSQPLRTFFSVYRWEIAICLCALLVFLPLLSLSEVFQVSEAREAVVVRTMLETGNYTLPLRHDQLVPSKPILFHWVSALLAKLIGEYSVFVTRLPSALSGIAMLLVLFGTLRRVADVRVAAIAVGILSSSYGFFRLSSDARVDMLFSSLVVAAICYWIVAAQREYCEGKSLRLLSGRDYRVVAFLSGLAVLTKGPLGLVLPGLVLLACLYRLEGGRACLSVFRIDWLVALAVALPWYLLATLSGKDSFFARQIVFENFSRFFGESGIARKPPWFYIGHIFSQAAPWSCIAFFVLLYLIGTRRLQSLVEKFSPLSRERRFAYASFLAWFVSVFIFISLSSGKRRAYLLPVLPAFSALLALAVVDCWDRFEFFRIHIFRGFSRKSIRIFVPLVWTGLLLALAVLVFRLEFLTELFGDSCPNCEVTFRSIVSVINSAPLALVALSVVLNIGFFAFWFLGIRRRSLQFLLLACASGMQFVFWVVVNASLSTKATTHSYKDFAQTLSTQYHGDAVFVKTANDESYESLFYYFPRLFLLHNPKRPLFPEQRYVTRVQYLQKMFGQEKWKNHVDVFLEGGRDVDEDGEELVLFKLR